MKELPTIEQMQKLLTIRADAENANIKEISFSEHVVVQMLIARNLKHGS